MTETGFDGWQKIHKRIIYRHTTNDIIGPEKNARYMEAIKQLKFIHYFKFSF